MVGPGVVVMNSLMLTIWAMSFIRVRSFHEMIISKQSINSKLLYCLVLLAIGLRVSQIALPTSKIIHPCVSILIQAKLQGNIISDPSTLMILLL